MVLIESWPVAKIHRSSFFKHCTSRFFLTRESSEILFTLEHLMCYLWSGIIFQSNISQWFRKAPRPTGLFTVLKMPCQESVSIANARRWVRHIPFTPLSRATDVIHIHRRIQPFDKCYRVPWLNKIMCHRVPWVKCKLLKKAFPFVSLFDEMFRDLQHLSFSFRLYFPMPLLQNVLPRFYFFLPGTSLNC